MKQKHYLLAFSMLALTTIGTVYARVTTAENDALAIASANISITQAISTAEQYVGGKAARAEYETYKGLRLFDLEVVKDNQVVDVKIDATSGRIIASTEDNSDHDSEPEKADS